MVVEVWEEEEELKSGFTAEIVRRGEPKRRQEQCREDDEVDRLVQG